MQRIFSEKAVVDLVVYDNSDASERAALTGKFIPELSVMRGNAIEPLECAGDMATKSFVGYKSVLMTGESGGGKTVCAYPCIARPVYF